jgi:hypothetical protein
MRFTIDIGMRKVARYETVELLESATQLVSPA